MNALRNVIWVDSNINGDENNSYKKELDSLGCFKFKFISNIEEAINYLKTIDFLETFIIISGDLYYKFIQDFHKNINNIYVIPKIVIFTSNKEDFLKNNMINQDFHNYINHPFYNLGGIHTSIDEIKKFIVESGKKKEFLKRDDEGQLNFEYIDCKEKLALPMFFKYLIEVTPYDKIEQFTQDLYIKYSKDEQVKGLLDPIISMKKIPNHLLSKYYSRMYTSESGFYTNLNNDLRQNKRDHFLPFIKVLYEGVRMQSLPASYNNKLYRGAKLVSSEINKIKTFLKNKANDLPSGIVFSKTFLSFTKDRKMAQNFLYTPPKNRNTITDNDALSKVLFILEKEENMDYSLSTHADIERLSFFPEEREVLFFPFSSFEIKDIKEVNFNNEKIYEISLLYLGKYIRKFKEENKNSNNISNLANSEFARQLIDSGLINKENIQRNNNTTKLYEKYENHKKNIFNNKNIIKNNPNELDDFLNQKYPKNYLIRRFKLTDILPNQKSQIFGLLKINENEVNKGIRIINSFEEYKRNHPNIKIDNEHHFINEKEIFDNSEIIINKQKIKFGYFLKFKSPGEYKIEFSFKNNLTKTDYMFADCQNYNELDLLNFNSVNITNMACMFYGCTLLNSLKLSNLYTHKVNDMSNMFCGCESLTNLDLSFFNTENVLNMRSMFCNCKSLKDINVSNFDTRRVVNMYAMFYGCESLINLNLSNFKTDNVKNMSQMFSSCRNLKRLNISNFSTKSAIYMSGLFSGNKNLENINMSKLKTSEAINTGYMFGGCISLKPENIIAPSNVLKLIYYHGNPY